MIVAYRYENIRSAKFRIPKSASVNRGSMRGGRGKGRGAI